MGLTVFISMRKKGDTIVCALVPVSVCVFGMLLFPAGFFNKRDDFPVIQLCGAWLDVATNGQIQMVPLQCQASQSQVPEVVFVVNRPGGGQPRSCIRKLVIIMFVLNLSPFRLLARSHRKRREGKLPSAIANGHFCALLSVRIRFPPGG